MSTSMNLFLELSKIPAYSSAQFQSPNALRVTSKVPDFDRNLYRSTTQTYVLAGETVIPTFGLDASEIKFSAVSPSGKLLAVFRESNGSGSTKRFVEIWENNQLKASSEVSKSHGAFYTDEILSLISFSPSEKSLVYTAEATIGDEKDTESLDKYYFVPPLGEGYPGLKKPGLYVLTWTSEKPSVKSLHPSNKSLESLLLTQPVFVSEQQLVAVGYTYTEDHRLLGVKFCPNRLAGIYSITLPEEIPQDSETDLQCSVASWTPPHISCRCPRVLHREGESSLLVYVSNAVGGPHASCSELHVVDLSTRQMITSVPIVEDPAPDAFPGLFTTTLPTHPFVHLSGEYFVISTSGWRSRSTVVLMSLTDGKVVDLTPSDDANYSWVALATDGASQLACSRSSLTSPPELLIGRLNKSHQVQWQTVASPTLSDELQTQLSSLEISITPVKDCHPVETIILKTKSAQTPLPCINLIHGGPHGAVTTGFYATTIALALEGYVINIPNYTGSTGFGEKYIKKLLGNIGSLEVGECVQSVRQLIDAGIAKSGPGQQFLLGGSHGGFISAHLLGQYPEIFSAASIRNPVTHLGDIAGTDIPDWYFEESGVPFTATSLVTPELYKQFYQMSPIAHVDKTRDDVPILLCIGEKDARVANAQGKAYYHALKGRKKDVKMIMLKEDSHGLDSVEATRVVFKATRELFEGSRK